MNIAGTQFTLNEGAFEIYISGCLIRCSEGCHNKELWNYEYGELYTKDFYERIKHKIKKFDSLISKICIYGGEPIDQDMKEFIPFLEDLYKLNKDIWLFTSYELINVSDEIIKYLSYIKCGKYDEAKITDTNIQYGIKLATSNQNIYKLK